MENATEIAEFCESRADEYRLFAALIDREVNEKTAAQLVTLGKALDPEAATDVNERMMVEGLQTMGRIAAHFDRELDNQLACDFARVFLAAGTYEGQAAVTYESVYTSEEHMLMQDARDEVLAYYRAARVMPDLEERGTNPEDYLPYELQFMAVMNERVAAHLCAGEDAAAARDAATQARFFSEHIDNWVDECITDIDEVTGQKFYHALAEALTGFVACEREDARALAGQFDGVAVAA